MASLLWIFGLQSWEVKFILHWTLFLAYHWGFTRNSLRNQGDVDNASAGALEMMTVDDCWWLLMTLRWTTVEHRWNWWEERCLADFASCTAGKPKMCRETNENRMLSTLKHRETNKMWTWKVTMIENCLVLCGAIRLDWFHCKCSSGWLVYTCSTGREGWDCSNCCMKPPWSTFSNHHIYLLKDIFTDFCISSWFSHPQTASNHLEFI